MAIAQSSFDTYRGRGYEGQVSTIDVNDIISRTAEADVDFGRAVVRGTGERSCAPVSGTTTPVDVIGFTARTLASYSNTVPSANAEYETGYHADETASVLRRGRMYALCLGGASAGDTVHVVISTAGGEELGQLRGVATDSGGTSPTPYTIELNKVRWVEDVVAGEIGEIQADGILTA